MKLYCLDICNTFGPFVQIVLHSLLYVCVWRQRCSSGDRCMAGWEAGQPCSKGPLHTLAFAAEGSAAPTDCSPVLAARWALCQRHAEHEKKKWQNLQMGLKIVRNWWKNTPQIFYQRIKVKISYQLNLTAITVTLNNEVVVVVGGADKYKCFILLLSWHRKKQLRVLQEMTRGPVSALSLVSCRLQGDVRQGPLISWLKWLTNVL